VAVAARSVLGTTLDVTHEALLLSVDLMELVPIPGLRAAALTLLNVWDCLQKVDVRDLPFIRPRVKLMS
jgi:abelson tyrosine-protein kinase 1